MKHRQKSLIACSLVAILIAVLFVLFVSFNNNVLVHDICLGLIISLLSSLLFALYSELFFEDDSDIISIKNNLSNIKSLCQLSKDFQSLGVCGINSISVNDRDPNYWIEILNNSHLQLDIIAHTLSPWFKERYRTEFTNKVIELANNKRFVRILILDPNGHNLEFVNTGMLLEYRKKIIKTIKNITTIRGMINSECRDYLDVRLNRSYIIPYSYIRNDQKTYISPYLCSNDERSSFITDCMNSSTIANAFNEDFEEIFENSEMILLFDNIEAYIND